MKNNSYYINMIDKKNKKLKFVDFMSVFFTIFGVLFLAGAFAFNIYSLAVISFFPIIAAIIFATSGLILKMRTHRLYVYLRK